MKTNNRHFTNREHHVSALVRLRDLLETSLARYLSYVRPWVRRRYLLLEAVARRISDEHENLAGCLARLISDRGGMVRSCVFPMEFTSYNDLSLEFLAPRLLEHQRALMAKAKETAEQLEGDPEARRIVTKVVASLKAYAELLYELLSPRRAASTPLATERSFAKVGRRPALSLGRRRFDHLEAEKHIAA